MISRYKELNDHYKIVILPKEGRPIEAYLQQDWVVTLQSGWGAEWEGAGAPAIFDTISQQAMGTSLSSQFLTGQKWMGSQPVSISLQLLFYAFSDPVKEVKEPVVRLTSLPYPASTIGVGLFTTPDAEVTLSIGSFIKIPNVLVKSAVPTWFKEMTPEGIPIGAAVNVMFETYRVPTAKEYRQYYGVS